LAAGVHPTTRARIPTRRSARLIAIGAITLAAFLTLALAPRAEAVLYWSNFGGAHMFGETAIGRANLDGTAIDQTFIRANSSPTGVAVDDTHVYWAEPVDPGSIARANLDGTGVDHNFIAADLPTAVAVDDAHVYWANWGSDSIGRANLDGSGVDQNFIIAPASSPFGVAVDATHVYWGDLGSDSIGRANLDGSGVDQNFITTAGDPRGVTADDTHVYWGDLGSDSIGRANMDGTGVDPSFIAGASAWDVAVDATHVYWASRAANSIGRANLDGTGVDQSFIDAADPFGVAVDSPAFVSFGKVKKNEKRGTATITAKVPVPGELRLAENRKVKGKQKGADIAGKEKLPVKPKGKAKKELNETGKAKVRAKVTYIPDGGKQDTRSRKIKLIKR